MIDTSIQFNNHNSYKATEDFWHKPFGVELMTHITIAAIFYATSPQAEANRIRVIFLDENGARVQVSNHAIGIGIDAARQSVTVAVPAGAKQAQIGFLAGNYWWAEAKAEEGETATAYAINAAGQLTYLTPNGIYTHTLQAKQIVITDNEALNDRLVTINQNHMALTDVVTGKTTKMTSDGVYTGEVVADQVKTGILQSTNNNSWINLDNGRFSFGSGALSWNGSLLQVTGRLISSGSGRTSRLSDGQFMVENGGVEVFNITNLGAAKDVNLVLGNGADRLLVSISDAAGTINDTFMIFNRSDKSIEINRPLKASSIYSKNGRERLAFLDDGYVGIKGGTNNVDRISIHSTYMILRDSSDRIRFNIHSTGEEIVATNGEQVFLHSGSTTALRCQNNSGHQIGVDSSGPYYMKNNSKTYF